MNEDPEVGTWLAELEHPLKDVILAVRTVFLEADDRITETIATRPASTRTRSATDLLQEA